MIAQEIQGSVRVISVRDAIDDASAAELGDTLREGASDGQPLVVLDLTHTPLMNSRGLEVLIDVQEEFDKRGGSLKLAGVGPLVLDILRATGIGDGFEIFGDTHSAVGS